MTHKQRLFVKALANGQDLEQAAEISGYNLKYARRKASEPAIQIVVDKLRDANNACPQQNEVDNLTPRDILWGLIEDPMIDDSQRIAAIRALIMYDRAHQGDRKIEPPIFIDDIPNCAACPNSGKGG